MNTFHQCLPRRTLYPARRPRPRLELRVVQDLLLAPRCIRLTLLLQNNGLPASDLCATPARVLPQQPPGQPLMNRSPRQGRN